MHMLFQNVVKMTLCLLILEMKVIIIIVGQKKNKESYKNQSQINNYASIHN